MGDTPEALVQGSPEWREFKLGKISASRFGDILTEPKSKTAREKGELSATAKSYLLDLVAETLTGQDQGPPTTWAMQWGIDCEPAARELYSELTGLEVRQVGFVTHPTEPMIGGSPDGLVGPRKIPFADPSKGPDGGLEIKCPANTRIHLGYMLGGVLPKEHIPQVQGHIWLNDCEWWDFVSYDPRIKGPGTLRLALWRLAVPRDEPYIKALERKVFAFRDVLLETLCNLKIGGQS